MEYSDFVHNLNTIACVVTIDLLPDGKYGDIRILDANERYRQTVVEDTSKFERNKVYTEYIKRDHNFEGMCYECADTKKPLHAYVDASYYNSWMELYMMPLISPFEDKACVLFSYDMTNVADAEKLGDVTPEASAFVLNACIKLRETSDFSEALNGIMKNMKEFCDSRHCTLLRTDFNARECAVLAEDYIRDGIEPPMDTFLNDKFFDIIETWPKLIDGSNCFIINNDIEWKRANEISPEWVRSLKSANVDNIIIYPLIANSETIAYIWAVDFDREKTLQIKEIMELTTFLLTSELSNQLMVEKMKVMSSTDLLTGVLNRNAMNNRISDNDSGNAVIGLPFGVFFIDVNGLKVVNDTQGHIAGDALLKDVSSTLCEIFKGHEIYRVGGDEFLVMTIGINKATFEKLEQELISKSDRPDHAKYAYGSYYCGDIPDVRKAMQIADARMYDNKEAFYKRHPELEWDRQMSRKNG